jgi:hypothetical protein
VNQQGWEEYVILIDGRERGVERTKKEAQRHAAMERQSYPGKGRVRIKKRRVGFRGNSARRETKAERLMRLQRKARKRAAANAAGQFLKKLNPAKAMPGAVRVKRLKGGGVTITPVKIVKGRR